MIDISELRQIAGLAVNVTEIYSSCRSYLKGIFNAIELLRWDRDLDGWKLHYSMEEAAALEVNDVSRVAAAEGYPLETKIISEIMMYIEALRVLFSNPSLLVVSVQPTDVNKLRYVVGDASAEGFGVGTQYLDLVFKGRDDLW